MALDFSQYLDIPVENISAAKPLPLGMFYAEIISWRGAERDYKNGEPVVPVVEFTYRTTGVCEVDDEGLLPDNGGIGVLVTRDYRLAAPNKQGKVEGGGQQAIRRFAEDGLKLDVKGLDLRDVLEAMKGQPVRVYNEPRGDKKNEGVYYNNITQVLPSE